MSRNTADLRRGSNIDFSGYYNEPEIDPITMAMQLLGMESKERSGDKALELQLLENMQQRRQGREAMELEREKLGETRAGNVETRRLAQAQEDRLTRALNEDTLYKKGQQDIARQQLIANALEKVAGVGQLSPEARLLIKNIPGMAEPFEQMEHETEMKTVMPQLQTAYANTDAAKREAAIKMLYGQMSPHARANAPWQDLNALIKPDAPGFWSRFGGAGTPPTVASAGSKLDPVMGQQQTSMPESPQSTLVNGLLQLLAPTVSGMTPSPEVYGGFSRSEPVEAPTEQTFSIDQLMALLSNEGEAERLPWLYGGGRPLMPSSQPIPVKRLPMELLNSQSRPLGVR